MNEKVQKALQEAAARENEAFQEIVKGMTIPERKELCERLTVATAKVRATVLSS